MLLGVRPPVCALISGLLRALDNPFDSGRKAARSVALLPKLQEGEKDWLGVAGCEAPVLASIETFPMGLKLVRIRQPVNAPVDGMPYVVAVLCAVRSRKHSSGKLERGERRFVLGAVA